MHSKAEFFQAAPGLTTSLVLGAVLIATTWNTPWFQSEAATAGPTDVQQLGLSYMTTYFVPFQLIALLLLITLMGAVVIARKEEGPPQRFQRLSR